MNNKELTPHPEVAKYRLCSIKSADLNRVHEYYTKMKEFWIENGFWYGR